MLDFKATASSEEDMSLANFPSPLHGTRAHAYYFFSVASLLLSNPQSEGRNRCSRPLSLSQEQPRLFRSKLKCGESF